MTFTKLLKAMSLLHSILCNPKHPIHIGVKILILLNYLLYISLYVLVHCAINNGDKTTGEVIWLIASLVLTFTLTSGALKELLISEKLQFIEINNFVALQSNIQQNYLDKAAVRPDNFTNDVQNE
jgi:hypothetical protein